MAFRSYIEVRFLITFGESDLSGPDLGSRFLFSYHCFGPTNQVLSQLDDNLLKTPGMSRVVTEIHLL